MNETTLEHPLQVHTSIKPESRPEATVDRDAFVKAMRGAVTGVNLVTTDGPAGRFGVTVSAFSSVSADPAMLLVCINRRSPACAAIHANKKFCVNVLSTDQRHIADNFAGRSIDGARYDFTAAVWNDEGNGSPTLADTVASFDCAVETTVQSGTHTIFIGKVANVSAGNGRPLLYTDRSYGRPCADAELN